MVTRKDLATLIAFLLFLGGFTSLMLSMVGIRWSFLSWLDDIGPLFGLIAKIAMIVFAIIILALVQTQKEEEDGEPSA
ncbi:MAG: hypothetical protein HKN76_13375 [Saprospiraceae bacterium]|nr:hypothetical protein [Saprospiraceae bacterium]